MVGTQRRQGCQANATPAQWCDAPGRGLAPTLSQNFGWSRQNEESLGLRRTQGVLE